MAGKHRHKIRRVTFFNSFKYQCGCGKYYKEKEWIEQWDSIAKKLYYFVEHELFNMKYAAKWRVIKEDIKNYYRDLAYQINSSRGKI